jgi:sialate O-acetylesterase
MIDILRWRYSIKLVVFIIAFSSVHLGFAQTQNSFSFSKLFGNNMVLQQGSKTKLWGTGIQHRLVSIDFGGAVITTTVDQSGNWIVKLPKLKAGGPFKLLAISGTDTICFSNVLIGDVWVASGQSNMQWNIGWGIDNKQETIDKALNTKVRMFNVADDLNNKPQREVAGGEWLECTHENAPVFSATAYFFAQELQQKLNIPIGIVNSSWGGTKITSWLSLKSLRECALVSDSLRSLVDEDVDFESGYEDFLATNVLRDSIIEHSTVGIEQRVFVEEYIDNTWPEMILPALWTNYGIKNYYGYGWFRKVINLNEAYTNQNAIMGLGEMCCESKAWFNGVELERLNNHSNVQFIVPRSLLKSGENSIALRVLGRWGVGGFNGPSALMVLKNENNREIANLASSWKYNIEIEAPTPKWIEYYNFPTYIYNAKIYPLHKLAIKGIIWYQGESDVDAANRYKGLFPKLISSWRQNWGQGDLPFIFGQLSNYGTASEYVEGQNVAELRQAQAEALSIPNTAMVVNIDLGKNGDVHFSNKATCGKRFATAALDIAYHKKVPVYSNAKSCLPLENKLKIDFSDMNNDLFTPDNKEIGSIEIAGADGQFKKANSKIDGEKLIVWNNKIEKPCIVRYGWRNNPECNLFNGQGLPIPPFTIKTLKTE